MQPVNRRRKTDPLLLLALVVGLGVLVTTTLPTSLRVAAEMLAYYELSPRMRTANTSHDAPCSTAFAVEPSSRPRPCRP